MNNQETNQTVNQPETVASVTNDQVTQATAPATDAKPTDNTQDTTASTPVAPTVPDTVKLELTADEAEMVQDLLSEYDYAYRSDREVDCKRELVRRDKVGKYPYVAESPAPEIINPAYDWVNKKWYSKSNDDNLNDIAQTVADLKARSDQSDQALKVMQETQNASVAQSLGVVKMMKQMSEDQSDMKKLMASMQGILLNLGGSKVTQPEAPKADAQPTQPETKQENGGN